MSNSDHPFEPPSVSKLPRIGRVMLPAEEETTSTEAPFPIRVMQRFDKLENDIGEMKEHYRVAASNSIATSQAVSSLLIEWRSHKKELDARVARIELDRFWMPRVLAGLSLLIATAAFVLALRTYR